MWSYYGSKSKIVDYYPRPIYDNIIEPFAGSARYSLKYFYKDVFLYDKYDVIVKTWRWLQKQNPDDLLALPILEKGESLDDYHLTEMQKMFYGFIVQQGTTGLRKTVSSFAENNVETQIKNIANQLYKIEDWHIEISDYRDIENKEATWFIDPPYQNGGHEYKHGNKEIDFNQLSEWCKSRKGQVIVCENTKADWLPFKPMIDMHGTMFKTTEAIWSNLPTNYDNIQQDLF